MNVQALTLAAICDSLQVSGKDLKQYFQEHIFGPAGLYNTYYDLSNGQVNADLGERASCSHLDCAALARCA